MVRAPHESTADLIACGITNFEQVYEHEFIQCPESRQWYLFLGRLKSETCGAGTKIYARPHQTFNDQLLYVRKDLKPIPKTMLYPHGVSHGTYSWYWALETQIPKSHYGPVEEIATETILNITKRLVNAKDIQEELPIIEKYMFVRRLAAGLEHDGHCLQEASSEDILPSLTAENPDSDIAQPSALQYKHRGTVSSISPDGEPSVRHPHVSPTDTTAATIEGSHNVEMDNNQPAKAPSEQSDLNKATAFPFMANDAPAVSEPQSLPEERTQPTKDPKERHDPPKRTLPPIQSPIAKRIRYASTIPAPSLRPRATSEGPCPTLDPLHISPMGSVEPEVSMWYHPLNDFRYSGASSRKIVPANMTPLVLMELDIVAATRIRESLECFRQRLDREVEFAPWKKRVCEKELEMTESEVAKKFSVACAAMMVGTQSE